MEKEKDNLTDLSESQILKEELFDLEDVDALLEQVMREAEEQSQNRTEEIVGDEEVQRMDAIMEKASSGVPMDDEILSMLQELEEKDAQERKMAGDAANTSQADLQLTPEENNIPTQDNLAGMELLLSDIPETEPEQELLQEDISKDKPKKKSLMKRILEFVFESDDEEQMQEEIIELPEDIDELENLSTPKPQGKDKRNKGKKDKKSKKEKAGKVTSASDNEAIAAELDEEDKKKGSKTKKKTKAKKAKAAKKKKEESPKERTEERATIGTFGCMATLLVCFSVLGGILVVCYALPTHLSLQSARKAFYAKEYGTALHRFDGIVLNKSDQILYKKAIVLNALEIYYEQYETYETAVRKKEALNALFDGYKACLEKRVTAEQFGVEEEWRLYKDSFMKPLQNGFGLSEDDVIVICNMKPLEYTIVLDNLLAGQSFDSVTLDMLLQTEESLEEEPQEENESLTENTSVLPDLLPEEEVLLKEMEMQEQQEDTEDKPLYEGTVKDGEVIVY